MKLQDLTQSDKGRWLSYRPHGQPHITDVGRIKDWNQIYVWVTFSFTQRPYWDTGPGERTALACLPDALAFVEGREDGGFNL